MLRWVKVWFPWVWTLPSPAPKIAGAIGRLAAAHPRPRWWGKPHRWARRVVAVARWAARHALRGRGQRRRSATVETPAKCREIDRVARAVVLGRGHAPVVRIPEALPGILARRTAQVVGHTQEPPLRFASYCSKATLGGAQLASAGTAPAPAVRNSPPLPTTSAPRRHKRPGGAYVAGAAGGRVGLATFTRRAAPPSCRSQQTTPSDGHGGRISIGCMLRWQH